MGAIVGASTEASDRAFRLAFGPNAGRKALTLQTVPVRTEQRKGDDLVSQQAGFSLYAGIACKSYQRKKHERLCRYITRPAIAKRRLTSTACYVPPSVKRPIVAAASSSVVSIAFLNSSGKVCCLTSASQTSLITGASMRARRFFLRRSHKSSGINPSFDNDHCA